MNQPSQQPGQGQNPALRAAFDRIGLQPRGRALAIGQSGSGKSTLCERHIEHWLASRPEPRVLILDGKPRFRGAYELSGFSAAKRYKHWRRGPTIPNSYVLPLHDPAAELDLTWKLGGRVAIAQVSDPGEMGKLRNAADAFYATSRDKYDQLLYVDELADFFGTSGAASRGDALLKVVRSGREKNISFLGAAQRPKGLPHSFLTELVDFYLFNLQADNDKKHLVEMGLPGDMTPPSVDFEFVHYTTRDRAAARYRLNKDLLDWGRL